LKRTPKITTALYARIMYWTNIFVVGPARLRNYQTSVNCEVTRHRLKVLSHSNALMKFRPCRHADKL